MLQPCRAILLCLVAAAACSSKGDGGTGPSPTIALSLSTSAATVVQGFSTPVVATLTRGGGFAGTVALTVEGAPTGVTGSVGTPVTSGTTTTATVTILVAATTAPGTYSLTLKGTGTGVTPATAPFSLTVTAVPAFSLSLSAGALTVTQGANDVVQVTIARTNFPDAVTLTLDGAPAGVTGVFAPPAPTGTASTLTVSVAAPVAPGVYNLTVHGVGILATPTDATTPLVLTVSAAPSFTLGLSLPALSIVQGGNAPTTVNITRTNFPGDVALAVTGAPPGVTLGFNPASPTTATSTVLTVTVGSAVSPGLYNLTVTGTGSVGNSSTPLALTVTQAAGSVVIDFASCTAQNKPVWLAVQADNGPWQRIVPVGDVYTITLTGTRGGIAYVSNVFPGTSLITTQYGTAAELTGGVILPCGPVVARRLVSATLQNIGPNNFGRIFYGGSSNTRTLDGLLQMQVPVGSFDFIAERATATNLAPNPVLQLIIRRGQTADNYGTLDLNGAESFPGGTAAFSTSALAPGELMQYFMHYYTGAACNGGVLLSSGQMATTSFNGVGVLGINQVPTDFHALEIATDLSVGNDFIDREAKLSFHTLAPKLVALPPVPPLPTAITTATWHRVKASFSRPAEYDGLVRLSYSDIPFGGREMSVLSTAGYLATQGGNTFIEAPQLFGLPGFDNAWLPQPNGEPFSIVYEGGTTTGPCSEGARTVRGTRSVHFQAN